MAKLFKTLSLEDRWKASVHHNGPVKPMPVDQGHIDLKIQGPIRDVLIPLLRSIPEPIQKPSNILKLTLSKASQAIQPLKPLDTKPLTSFAIPFVNTKFRSAISLADRLKQPNFGSTTHLAQYFLADQYTDYIKITPFGIFNHTSDTVVHPITFLPQQGGNNPTLIAFNAILSQGAYFSNGSYFSNINVTIPAYDILLLQGTSLSNGIYVSNTNTTITPGSDSFIIDPNTITGNISSITAVEYTQGIVLDSLGQLVSGIIPSIVPTGQSILLTQGVVITPSNTLTSYINPTLPGATSAQGGEDPQTPITTPQQGGVTPTPITFVVNSEGQSPILDVLYYEGQRALATFAPKIVHGSSELSSNQTVPGYFQNTTTFFAKQPIVSYASGLLRTDSKTWITGIEVKGNKQTIEFLKSGEFGQDGKENGLGTTSQISAELGKDDDKIDILGYTKKIFDKKISRQDKRTKALPDGTNYHTLSYEQILARANESKTLTDFRSGLTGLKGGNGKQVVVSENALGEYFNDLSVKERGVLPQSTANDFITLNVKSIRDGASISFRAFITSFSDSVNVSWNDINYVGRQDTLKAYKGSVRGGSIAFKVAALCEEDMSTNYAKLNSLVQYAGVGKPEGAAGSDLYIRGPLCAITVGRWFTNTPVVFNSIKFDIQMAEYSWDIDKKVPQLVDVSLDFVVLGDNAGQPLGTTNNYFNYGG